MKINHLKVAEDLFRKSIETRRADARSNKEAAPEISKWHINKGFDDVFEEPSDIGLVQKESDDARWQRINELWEGLELSLLRYVFFVLKQHGLVQNGQDFSQRWCGKNPNWFSYQTAKGRTFSLDAAINCLLELRQYIKYQTDAPEEYHKAIDELADLITQFLAIKYRVTGVIDRPK